MKIQKNKRLLIWMPVFALGLLPISASGDSLSPGVNRTPAGVARVHAQAQQDPDQDQTPQTQTQTQTQQAPVQQQSKAQSRLSALQNQEQDTGDISIEDIKGLVQNWEVQQDGSTVRIYGTLPTVCANKLTVSNSNTNSDLRSSNIIGFELSDDDGQFRACMKQQQPFNCRKISCSYLSQFPGSSLDLSHSQSGPVVLASFDPSGDANKWRIDGTGFSFQSNADKQKLLIAKLKSQVTNCRTGDNITVAEGALATLRSMGAIGSDLDKKYSDEMVDSQAKALLARVGKTKLTNMTDLISDTESFADQNPQACAKAVTIFQAIAEREENDDSDTKSRKNYTAARSALTSAKDLDCLDQIDDGGNTEKEIAKALDDNQIGEFGFCAQNGDTTCLQSMSKTLSKSLMKKENSACRNVKSVESESSCVDAMKEASDVNQLMNLGVQVAVQNQRQDMQQQMQLQQLQSQLNGGLSTSMFSNYNFGGNTLGMNGMSMYGMNGMGMGGGNYSGSGVNTYVNPSMNYSGSNLGMGSSIYGANSYNGAMGFSQPGYTGLPSLNNANFVTSGTSVGPAWAGGMYSSTIR
jgi:hypothetical protein